jgi:hypothetical protein
MQSRASDKATGAKEEFGRGRQLSRPSESERRRTGSFKLTARILPKPESNLLLDAGWVDCAFSSCFATGQHFIWSQQPWQFFAWETERPSMSHR